MSIVILVASSGMGKTTACRRAVKLAKAAGFRAAGLLSVPLYRDGAKAAIVLYEIHGHSWRTLARAHGESQGPQVGIWVFEQRALAWGQQVLASLPACDLLVIDEIGPLEIEQGLGLTNAYDVLRRPGYRLALVSLRPSLAEALARRLGGMTIAVQALDEMNRDSLPKALVQKLKEAPGPTARERRRNGHGKRGSYGPAGRDGP
jgi:nucleoside-triphosphatase THEP1